MPDPMFFDEFCIAVHGTVPGKGQGPLRETLRRVFDFCWSLGINPRDVITGEFAITTTAGAKLHAICDEFKATIAHAESIGKGGMQVPFHGDFASAARFPSVISRMRWWVREFETALRGDRAGAVVRGEANEPTPMTIQWCQGHSGLGWYYWVDELPEEGSAGPFASFAEAKTHADESGAPYVFTVAKPQVERNPRVLALKHLRELRQVETPCTVCVGTGVRTYDNTSTWSHGAGGQSITSDVCDHCWGSGDEHRHWQDLRRISRPVDLGPLRALAERWASQSLKMREVAEQAFGTELSEYACARLCAERDLHLDRMDQLLAAIREAEGGG